MHWFKYETVKVGKHMREKKVESCVLDLDDERQE